MSRAVAGFAWIGSATAALAVARVSGDYTDGYCGPWGCYPPGQALAAMHLFWLMLLSPAGWLAGRRWGRAAGWGLVGGGLAMLAGLEAHAFLTWGIDPALWAKYAGRRAVYAAATGTDWPAGQLVLAGVGGLAAARRRVTGCPGPPP
jgi:hypothetical protein